jgi:G protein-coupled receptor GPR1
MPHPSDSVPDWQSGQMLNTRNLNSPTSMGIHTTFSDSQNRAILIAGLTCACVSFVAAFSALRWFILMKRSFRHRLVLFLIASDTFKALWYFIFGTVAIARGPISSDSSFCQASGFFLLLGVEASDFAILVIALHTLVSIFKAASKAGEGGLYPYRNWIYLIWLGPPLVAASLAFVNANNAYVTSGAHCYLPKRPYWYRLALSWIPRYLIIGTIFAMYASIYVYVHIKFKNFSVLRGDDSSEKSGAASRNSVGPAPTTAENIEAAEAPPQLPQVTAPKSSPIRPSAFRMHSYNSILGASPRPLSGAPNAPWDGLSFITAMPLQEQSATQQNGVASEDFAQEADSTGSQDTHVPPRGLSIPNGKEATEHDSRKASEAPTMQTNYTGETATTRTTFNTTGAVSEAEGEGATDHLRQTRLAIRRQLRFLFIYPLIYVLMWSFPFASHALNYDDYYVNHPIFWLSVVNTCSLALQAGVDSVVFSWREKPWRQIDDNSRWSIPHFKGQIVDSVHRGSTRGGSNTASAQIGQLASMNQIKRSSSHWWEAEGRKRKDSVWMGTDALNRLASQRDQRSNVEHDDIAPVSDRASERSSAKSGRSLAKSRG